MTPPIAPQRVAFMGDSWTWGVGVATRCGHPIDIYHNDPTLMTSVCPQGQSISDNIARDLNVAAYQNLGIGGTFVRDVDSQVSKIDPSINEVVISIGFNDETAAAPNQGSVVETVATLESEYSKILTDIHARVPMAKIFLLVPPNGNQVPLYAGATYPLIQQMWANVQTAVQSESANAAIVTFGDMAIYDSAYYVPVGTCPTAGLGDCGGAHPNSTGTTAMASALVPFLQ